MPQRSPHNIALDLLREWEEGKSPALEDYVARIPGVTRETIDLVADCLIFDALALPLPERLPLTP